MKYYESLNQGNLRIAELLENINQNGIKVIDDFWQNLIIQGSGAFLGAFFAFLFGGLAFFIKNARDRFLLHQKAVVELEYLLWEHYDLNLRNKQQITNSISILKKEKHITYNRFYLLRISPGLDLKLGDLYIINPYATYLQSVDRVNSSIEALNRIFDIWTQMLLLRQPPSQEEINSVITQMEEFIKILHEFDSEIEDLLTLVRVYIKRLKSRKERGVNYYKLNGYRKITEQEKNIEKKKMDNEIKENARERKEKENES